jgi:hypothetical protein
MSLNRLRHAERDVRKDIDLLLTYLAKLDDTPVVNTAQIVHRLTLIASRATLLAHSAKQLYQSADDLNDILIEAIENE